MLTTDEKKQVLTKAMDHIIILIKEGEAGNWIRDYAEISVSTWGPDEMIRQCHAIENTYTNRKNPDGETKMVRVGLSLEQHKFIGHVKEIIGKN